MSTIKPKMGQCVDCDPGGADKPLIAGRCNTHYWRHRQKESNSRKTVTIPKSQKASQDDELRVFFASQLLQIPKHCEECGSPLNATASWMRKAMIAHILPKRNFKSVATHPQNRFFGCLDCHTDYDNRGAEHVVKMKIFPILQERFNSFKHLILPEEFKYLPTYFEI